MDPIYQGYACIPKPIPAEPGCVIREVPMGVVIAPGAMHLACTAWFGGDAFFGLIVANRVPTLTELGQMLALEPTLFRIVTTP